MGRLNKRALIQQILTERGYTDWCVVELRKIDSGNSAVECILFNFREGRKAELVIPHHWFQDGCPLIGRVDRLSDSGFKRNHRAICQKYPERLGAKSAHEKFWR
jgi:hypothetical protein